MTNPLNQSEELADAADIVIKGISDIHDVTVTEAVIKGGSAYVGQPLFRSGGRLYGGTLCTCRSYDGDVDKSNAMATHLATLHNINAARLRGEI